MASGIACAPEVLPAYNNVKDKHLNKFVTFKFNKPKNPTQIIVDVIGEKDATFEDMRAAIPRDEVRYFVYDCEYKLKDGQERKKVALGAVSDDDSVKITQKMLVSSTSDSLKAVCKGFHKFITINDYEELNEQNFLEIISSGFEK